MTLNIPPPVVPLTADDDSAFQSFSCDRGTPWSEAIEHMVRTDLARAGGALRITGRIFHENSKMISIMRGLDAVVDFIPDNDEYLMFVLAV